MTKVSGPSNLFKGGITLSIGQRAIQLKAVNKTNHTIHWTVSYPVDNINAPFKQPRPEAYVYLGGLKYLL